MSKFKVGDRVVIIKESSDFDGLAFNSVMENLAQRGGIHTVKVVLNDSTRPWIYLEGHGWAWLARWLEHAEQYDSL